MKLVKVDHLCKTYGTGEAQVEALKNASFTLEKGEFAAVIGEYSLKLYRRSGYPYLRKGMAQRPGSFFHV